MDMHIPYREIEKVLDLPASSLTGNENLEDLPEWDSIATISFIAWPTVFSKLECLRNHWPTVKRSMI
jgi:hypothetical protein